MKINDTPHESNTMELQDLGFTGWFHSKLPEIQQPDRNLARVVAVDKEKYLIKNSKGEIPAEIIGKIRFEAESNVDFPTIGDWVYVQYFDNDTFAIIHEIFPRKSLLKRKTAGKRVAFQLIAANIDTAFIIQSLDHNFNVRRLERYLVMVHEGDIEPVILLSKYDLINQEQLVHKIKEIKKLDSRYKMIAFSNKTGEGLDHIQDVITPGLTYCLLGSSGVGKTSLINRLIGQDKYATKLVREKDSRGRHATNRRQLLVLNNGGLIIDTPGMRELGNFSVDSGLNDTFSDIVALSRNCHFADCTHTSEPGCSVLEAVEKVELSAGRYQNYIKLRKESDYNEMSYLEKRKKDKKFGKFYKSVMKNIKKR